MMPPFDSMKSLADLDERVRKLVLSKVKGDRSTLKEKRTKSWPTPLDAELLLAVFDSDKAQVTLSKGLFNIKRNLLRGTIWVSPPRGFVPCGWYSRNTLEKIILESALEDDSTSGTDSSSN